MFCGARVLSYSENWLHGLRAVLLCVSKWQHIKRFAQEIRTALPAVVFIYIQIFAASSSIAYATNH